MPPIVVDRGACVKGEKGTLPFALRPVVSTGSVGHMHSRETIGMRIRWAREQIKISGRELARVSGLGENTVGKIESGGSRDPSASSLIALADALGVSIDWLADGRGPTPTKEQLRVAVERARSLRRAER